MKKIIWIFILLFVALNVNTVFGQGMGQIKIKWDKNTEADVVDQTEAGYKVYLRAAGGVTAIIDVGNFVGAALARKTLTGLTAGDDYDIVVTCYDTSKNESVESSSITATAKNVEAPAQVTGLVEE